MVGVKAELGTPDPSQPNAGRIEFFVDWCVCVCVCTRVSMCVWCSMTYGFTMCSVQL